MNSGSHIAFRAVRLVSFLLAAVLAVPSQGAEPAAAGPHPVGRVAFIRGKASASGADRAERPLLLQSPVFPNDRIVCAKDSKLEIRFGDNSSVWLGENSEVAIDEYVYSPDKKNENSFSMRFVTGMCRIATGAITALNPERFKVRSRLATIGIRGCELALTAKAGANNVYVLRLGKKETVVVTTTADGRQITDPATGVDVPADQAPRKVVNVERANTAVAVEEGRGFQFRAMEKHEIELLMRETSHAPAARYEPMYTPDSSVIRLRPAAQGAPAEGAGTD